MNFISSDCLALVFDMLDWKSNITLAQTNTHLAHLLSWKLPKWYDIYPIGLICYVATNNDLGEPIWKKAILSCHVFHPTHSNHLIHLSFWCQYSRYNDIAIDVNNLGRMVRHYKPTEDISKPISVPIIRGIHKFPICPQHKYAQGLCCQEEEYKEAIRQAKQTCNIIHIGFTPQEFTSYQVGQQIDPKVFQRCVYKIVQKPL